MICIAINSYNYCQYVAEAVDSALAQSLHADRILVIDDGSTDGSVELLRDRYGDKIELIVKANGGQLSCFNEVAVRIGTKDIVFFLDADDRFLPNHVERCLSVYDNNPDVDFVFTRHKTFGTSSEPGQILCKVSGDLGYSVFSTRELQTWLGGPTSTLSMKGSILRKFLPCPLESDWKVRADDVLVMGASLAGARKYFLDEPTVDYRVHDKNNFCNRSEDLAKGYRYTLAKQRMLNWTALHLGMPYKCESQLLAIEFKLFPHKSISHFKDYLIMNFQVKGSTMNKIRTVFSLIKSYCR